VSQEVLIAVIDDDETFREALVEALESLGYGVRGFASAEEFVEAGAESSCRCVITDIQMPGMNGLDLAALLAARDSTVPVIMITGQSEPDLETRATACGAIGLLRKPFPWAALLGCVKKALKG
jgi:FixJ family two-component response regulator